MPDQGRRRRSRRKREEAWLMAVTVLVLGTIGFFWILSVYNGGR